MATAAPTPRIAHAAIAFRQAGGEPSVEAETVAMCCSVLPLLGVADASVGESERGAEPGTAPPELGVGPEAAASDFGRELEPEIPDRADPPEWSVGATATAGLPGKSVAAGGNESAGFPRLTGSISSLDSPADWDIAIARSTAARARFGANGRRARASSAVLEKRCSRSLARHLSTTAQSAGGTSVTTSARRGAGFSSMDATSSGKV
jgi:hypothetical protein